MTRTIGGLKKGKGEMSYPLLSPKQIKSFVSTLKAGQMIQILWIDAFSERGWKTTPEINTAHPCAVCGYYINCKDGYLRIGVNRAVVFDEEFCSFSDHWGIPTGMIFGIEKF